MARFVQPPQDQLDKLRRPLTPGERRVFEVFDARLPHEWEIYIEPHLNGLRPDFVLLHPKAGIAVFEVKDWNLDAVAPRRAAESLDQVLLYKEEIYNLYCPRLAKQFGFAAITAGVIFPFADDERLRMVLASAYQRLVNPEQEKYYPLVGRSALASGNLRDIFPEACRSTSKYMSPTIARDLRNWLVEPDFAATQRTPLGLDENQKRYVTTRTATGYRRIKGPAGSGKSVVLAARAAQLAAEGQEVLVVTYNITLLHLLMDLAVRWHVPISRTRQKITWLNFHHWCKRTCQQVAPDKYRAMWRQYFESEATLPDVDRGDWDGRDAMLNVEIPRLVSELIAADANNQIPRYDAILVDEGQDFRPEWWNVLCKVLKPGGEMLLAADATQDIYGTADLWTEQAMNGAGFSGPWAQLPISYRLPPLLVRHAREFAQAFLPGAATDIPVAEQTELFDPCQLRWIQAEKQSAVETCVREILAMPVLADPYHLSIPDITFLCDGKQVGMQVVDALGLKNVKTIHTFSKDDREGRRLKLGFYMGDARVKATTIHSFKGWETRALVLYVQHARGQDALAKVYAGMTRLKRHFDASYLTVVCSAPELEAYGRRWPVFERATART